MKIESIKLKNFCAFDNLNDGNGINLDGKSIVLFGENESVC